MTESWAFGGEPPRLTGDGSLVTLVEGSTFCLSTNDGSMVPGVAHGLFVRDTRFLSGWRLGMDDRALEPLTYHSPQPFTVTFVARTRPPHGHADSALLIQRRRYIGDGMREDVIVRNLGNTPACCVMSLEVESDFADLFEVKENRVSDRTAVSWSSGKHSILGCRSGSDRSVRVTSADASVFEESHLRWTVELPGRGEWRTCIQVDPIVGGETLPARHPCGVDVEHTLPAIRLRQWRERAPIVRSGDHTLDETVRRSLEDVGSLRIFDPDYPDRAAIAAGAPWFMTLFGRDSLLASYMMLSLDPRLALGTLQTLARFQGSRSVRSSEEQPGRILHEMRFGAQASLSLGGGNVYYGTADATPLFVMLLGELRRWGGSREAIDELLPHADRALEWVDRFGDSDGDGFVEYQRHTERGLANQGWKDSWDGINFADGTIAEAPIALCEVQGYVYAAFIARAHFAQESGQSDDAAYWTGRARRLKRAFNEAFWLPDRGWYAVGLDRDKRPIDALTSNIGHCLWTGIVDADKAALVVRHLLAPEMFSGWGVRTLATTMGAYNPTSYHNGSVWPHDNALLAAGLMRHGFTVEAQLVASAILGAAAHFGGRLPELFCGFDRSDVCVPVPYPTSCSPQAWAAAAPVQLLRTLLRLDPEVPSGRVWVSPVIPESMLPLRIDNLNLADSPISIEVSERGWDVDRMPSQMVLIREPNPHTRDANGSPGR